jgi:hypothetical protein
VGAVGERRTHLRYTAKQRTFDRARLEAE